MGSNAFDDLAHFLKRAMPSGALLPGSLYLFKIAINARTYHAFVRTVCGHAGCFGHAYGRDDDDDRCPVCADLSIESRRYTPSGKPAAFVIYFQLAEVLKAWFRDEAFVAAWRRDRELAKAAAADPSSAPSGSYYASKMFKGRLAVRLTYVVDMCHVLFTLPSTTPTHPFTNKNTPFATHPPQNTHTHTHTHTPVFWPTPLCARERD